MNIDLSWQKTIVLRDGTKDSLIFNCDLKQITEKPGIYVFARKFGQTVEPLYIGQATNLRKRIKEQLNTTRLMIGLKTKRIGIRILLVGVLKSPTESKVNKKLNIAEHTCIQNALSGICQ